MASLEGAEPYETPKCLSTAVPMLKPVFPAQDLGLEEHEAQRVLHAARAAAADLPADMRWTGSPAPDASGIPAQQVHRRDAGCFCLSTGSLCNPCGGRKAWPHLYEHSGVCAGRC